MAASRVYPWLVRRPSPRRHHPSHARWPQSPTVRAAEPRPAVVALDLDPHRHTLNYAGKFAGDNALRGISANWAPVDLLTHTTRPLNGSANASRSIRTGLPGLDAGQAVLLQVGLDIDQLRAVQAQQRGAGRDKVAQVAVPLDDDGGERGSYLGIRQVILGCSPEPRRASWTDCSLTLTSNSISWVWSLPISGLKRSIPLAAFCSAFCAASTDPAGDADLGSARPCRLCQPGLGEVDLCAEAESRDCVTCCCCRSGLALLLEPGEAFVLKFGECEGGFAALTPGARLVNSFLDFVTCVSQGFLRFGPVCHRGGERAPGDLDLNRNLLADQLEVEARWRASSACAESS